MLNVTISGVITGLLYALAGQSLVVVYRTTKVLNFALGGAGVAVGFAAYGMLQLGVPYWLVIPAAILFGAVLGAVIERLLVYPLRKQPALTISVATLGVLLVFEGITGWIWGSSPKSLPPAFADAGTLRIGDIGINGNQIFILVTAVAATALLLFLIEKTKLGLGMRATSSGPLTASLIGVNVGRMRLSGWVLGGAYGALAALLVTPLTYLSPTSFVTFILTAFAAVVLGGFTSIIGVVIGAIVFGVGTNVLVVYLHDGLIATYTLVGVALILVFRPNGFFGKVERDLSEPEIGGKSNGGLRSWLRRKASSNREPVTALTPGVKRRLSFAGWGIALVLLAIVPFVGATSLVYLVAMILATYLAVVGLNIVTGFSGQISLATSGLAAIGGYALAISLRGGMSLPIAILLSVISAAIGGAVLGVIASRLSGVYLALLTLLFSFAVPELIAFFGAFTGGIDGIPVFVKSVGTAKGQYWLVLGIAAAVTLIVLWLTASRVGRNWRAVRDSENGARALGLDPARVKLGAFVFGSALAGLSGGLIALLTAFIGPDSFTIFFAIYVLLAVVLGGSGSIGGSLVGAAFIVWIPKNAGDLPVPLIFGAALILVLLVAPGGIGDSYSKVITRLLARRGKQTIPVTQGWSGATAFHGAGLADVSPSSPGKPHLYSVTTQPNPDDVSTPAALRRETALLRLENVEAGYSAGLVLNGLSLTVRKGEMVTLLGANGAGKTTALRTISGLLPILNGSISWAGEAIGGRSLHSPHQIARSSLAHVPEGRGIFPDLSVLENLKLGRFADTGQSRSQFEDTLDQVFTYFPILKKRLRQDGGTLSGGEQQMLAIGRALVGSPKMLMLDEPSLGLSPLYSQQVLDNLRRIVDEGEISVLLIEQNARAALEHSDRAYVLSRGVVVLEGTANELLTQHDLSELYLAVES